MAYKTDAHKDLVLRTTNILLLSSSMTFRSFKTKLGRDLRDLTTSITRNLTLVQIVASIKRLRITRLPMLGTGLLPSWSLFPNAGHFLSVSSPIYAETCRNLHRVGCILGVFENMGDPNIVPEKVGSLL